MLHVPVPAGAIFYGRPRRRQQVVFTDELRQRTAELAKRVHELLASGHTPPPHYDKKCRGCSLIDLCMPRALEKRSVRKYLAAAIRSAVSATPAGHDTAEGASQ